MPAALTSKSVIGSSSEVVTATWPARCRIASWSFDVLGQSAGVPHVLFDECRARRVLRDQPPEVALRTGTAEVVEHRDVPSVADELDRRIDA